MGRYIVLYIVGIKQTFSQKGGIQITIKVNIGCVKNSLLLQHGTFSFGSVILQNRNLTKDNLGNLVVGDHFHYLPITRLINQDEDLLENFSNEDFSVITTGQQ